MVYHCGQQDGGRAGRANVETYEYAPDNRRVVQRSDSEHDVDAVDGLGAGGLGVLDRLRVFNDVLQVPVRFRKQGRGPCLFHAGSALCGGVQ
jgi:hypothetical protein